jgi:sugar phosphate isomerase/epimerase
MQYAFMSFSAPQLDLHALLALATQYGYDGIEPRIGGGHGHGVELECSPDRRRAIRAHASDSGIALCCLATSCQYADPATASHWIEQTRRAIALAADIGAPRLRVFGGAIPPQVERAAAIDQVATALRSVAGVAQQHGVTLCLETHDDWTDPAHVAAVMQRVDHPAVGVNWDYMHTIRVAQTSVDQAFTMLQPWIRHVHFHDGANRGDQLIFLPIGAGEYDTRRVIELLLGTGYNGYLSGEWINWEPYYTHLPRELAAIRQIEAYVRSQVTV